MIVEILSAIDGQAVRIPAAQLLIRNDDGTPVVVAGEFGPQNTIRAAVAGDADFQRTLSAFGYNEGIVEVDHLTLPPPVGGRLISGPGIRRV